MFNEYLTNEARKCNEVKTLSSIDAAGKIGQKHAKTAETRLPPYTNIQNKLRKD